MSSLKLRKNIPFLRTVISSVRWRYRFACVVFEARISVSFPVIDLATIENVLKATDRANRLSSRDRPHPTSSSNHSLKIQIGIPQFLSLDAGDLGGRRLLHAAVRVDDAVQLGRRHYWRPTPAQGQGAPAPQVLGICTRCRCSFNRREALERLDDDDDDTRASKAPCPLERERDKESARAVCKFVSFFFRRSVGLGIWRRTCGSRRR